MRRSVIVAGVALGLLAAGPAGARDMSGRIGVGGARTLGGVQGIDVTYWAGRLAVTGTAALSLQFPDVGNSGVGLSLAGGALFQLAGGDAADLSFGGRLNLGTAPGEDLQLTIEAPLRLEWYASEHLSLHGEVGIVVEIIGDKGRVLTGAGSMAGSGGGTGFIIGSTWVTAGGGFTVYF